MEKLYDRADIYDLLENGSRYEITKWHWQYLLKGKPVRSLLDVSIGSGNMTLPVLDLGIDLYGSDLSEAMLSRCDKKATAKGYSVHLQCSDFREVSKHFTRQFDCVASTGNSLAYVTNEEVITALHQMDALVAPGGYLYFDLRNWDKIRRTKQRFYTYNPSFHGNTRVNLVQVWDHNFFGPHAQHRGADPVQSGQVFCAAKSPDSWRISGRAACRTVRSVGFRRGKIPGNAGGTVPGSAGLPGTDGVSGPELARLEVGFRVQSAKRPAEGHLGRRGCGI